MASTALARCSTTSTAAPPVASPRTCSSSSAMAMAGARFAVGSSSRKIPGSSISTRPMASIFRSPPLSLPAGRPAMPTRLLSRVLLPEPLGPTSDTTSPGSARTVMPRITGSPPYPAVMPSARSGSPRRVTSADKVGLHNLLPAPQLRHRSLREDCALGHHHDRVAELVHDGQFVLDHEDRHALGAQGDQ